MGGGFSRASVLLVAIGVLGSATSAEAFIKASFFKGRLDATYSGGGQYRVWTIREQNGSISSRRDAPLSEGGSIWVNHGAGTTASNDAGPAATSYAVGADNHELVVYVGLANDLNIGHVVNGGPISWKFVDAPQKPLGGIYELSGNIAVTTFTLQGHRFLLVGATTADGHLFRFVGDLDDNLFGGWTDSSAGFEWIPNGTLAASTSPDGTIANIFASHTPGAESLGIVRWNLGWSTANLGRPFGRRACQSIGAAQGALSGGVRRVLVACTPYDSVNEVYVAVSNSYSSFSFSWLVHERQPPGNVYQSVAVVLRPAPGLPGRGAPPPGVDLAKANHVFDIYLSSLNQSTIDKGTYDKKDEFTLVNLGPLPEGGVMFGGLSAVPLGSASRLFFVADQNGRNSLYERYGGRTTAAPQNYRAYGDSDFNSFGFGDFFAEGKIGVWRGTMAASVIQRPGDTGSWPQVYFLYSAGEGKTLFTPEPVPNVVGNISTTYSYVSDPTTVVTDLRAMYSVQIGVNFGSETDTCVGRSLSEVTDNVIYMVSTTPQTFPAFSFPQVLDRRTGLGIKLDHPYSDIQHRDELPDVIHVAWWDVENSKVRYCPIAEGSTWFGEQCANVVDLDPPGASPGGPPRVTASDSGRVIVYYGEFDDNVHGSVLFCELNSTLDGCTNGGFQSIPIQFSAPGSFPNNGPGISGSSFVQTVFPFSLAASESGDKLYYCFSRVETNGPGPDGREEMDSFCTIGRRDPLTGLWSWNDNVVALMPEQDDFDQFSPEVAITQESGTYSPGGETAIVTFYDRSQDPANLRYRAMRAVSSDSGLTYYPARQLFGGADANPENLPRHCLHSTVRFIGDYAGVEGYTLHAQSLSFMSFAPGQIRTTTLASFGSVGRWAEE